MVVTKLNDIINPQVMGDMIDAKIEALAKLTPYAKVDTTLQGVPGDTKTVPSWNYIGDAEDFDPESGEEMETVALTATAETFTIKCAGKSVGIYQTAINSGLGNPVGQAETQLAKSIIGKVDNDVLEAAYKSNHIVGGETPSVIGYAGVVDAVTDFVDEEDGIDKVMFIHPTQESTLLKDSDFLSADKFEAGVAIRGSIGKIAGCWVKKSKKVKHIEYVYASNGSITIVADSVTEDSTNKHLSTVLKNCLEFHLDSNDKLVPLAVGDKVNALTSTKQYWLNPIIKNEPDSAETEFTEDELPAITIFLKKNTQVDHEWFPKKQKHDITAAKYYGVALTNASKVILAKFKKA